MNSLSGEIFQHIFHLTKSQLHIIIGPKDVQIDALLNLPHIYVSNTSTDRNVQDTIGRCEFLRYEILRVVIVLMKRKSALNWNDTLSIE